MSAAFLIAGGIAVAGAVGVIAARTPVHNVIALVINFIGLAVLYITLQAEFLAVVQIIVYAGAIMILFLFVIALLTVKRDPSEGAKPPLAGQTALGIAAAIGVAGLLAIAALRSQTVPPAVVGEGFGTVAAFGRELLVTHVFPFELSAFVLMVALVGVVILVGRRQS